MTDERGPAWARTTLWIAAAYNLAFGAFAVLWPSGWFELGGMDVPDQLYLWQCIGMIVGVYGIGYACAAVRPLRHWPIVLVGLLGKVLGPIGFFDAAMRGVLPWSSGWLIVSNDLIWWIPFIAILVATWRLHRAPAAASAGAAADEGASSTPVAAS